MSVIKKNCKNCNSSLPENSNFCDQCGGKIIGQRLSIKQILNDVGSKVFGLDSTYLRTVKDMLSRPQEVLSAFVSGVRKRYLHPLTFLTIAATLAIIFFNFFSDDFVKISATLNAYTVEADVNSQQKKYDKKVEGLSSSAIDSLAIEPFDAEAYRKKSMTNIEKGQRTSLKYFNLLTFCLIPFYSFVSFLVFGKPYNFAEHLTFNAYIQGITFYGTTLFFLLSLVTHPLVYFVAMIFTVVYYSHVFARLYQLNLGQSIVKFFKFVGIALIPFALIFLFGVVVGSLKG